MKSYMKSLIVVFTICLFGAGASAIDLYDGETKTGEICYLRMNLEDQKISFYSEEASYTFSVTKEELLEAIKRDENPVYLKSRMAELEASISILFDINLEPLEATYSQATYTRAYKVHCMSLVK